MGGQTDVRTDSPCVLQDFVPLRAEALLTYKTAKNKPLSRARVPMSISCLWATVFFVVGIDSMEVEWIIAVADKPVALLPWRFYII